MTTNHATSSTQPRKSTIPEQIPQLNTMCSDCIKRGTTCHGTAAQVWTGCAMKARKQ